MSQGPQVRARDELQRGRAADRIDRDPEAHVLRAVDIVVGLVLVPGRRLARGRLLGEHVIVIKARGAAPHETAGRLGQRGVENESPVVRVVLPVAEVLDEPPGVRRGARDFRARAQPREIQIDAGLELRDLAGIEQARQMRTAPSR